MREAYNREEVATMQVLVLQARSLLYHLRNLLRDEVQRAAVEDVIEQLNRLYEVIHDV
jgi:tRNA A22 N-methylase